MSTFIFNGVSCDELGLIVTKTPVPPCQQETRETIYVPGGNTLQIYKNTRKNIAIVINTTVIEPDRIRDIYQIYQGSGKLILSSEPDKYYRAVCNPLSPANVAMYMNNITFEFECVPYAYAVDNTPELYDAPEIKLTNNGTYYAQPVYTLHGNGELTLNVNGDIANALTVYGVQESCVVDTERLIVYEGDKWLKTKGRLPFLSVGENIIRTNANKIEIVKNERWL